MLFLKSVAIFLVTAIVNPICCCNPVASIAEEGATAHACCEGLEGGRSTENGGEGGHDAKDCFHASDRSSQINQIPDSADGLSKSHSKAEGVYTAFSVPVFGPHSVEISNLSPATGRHGLGESTITRTYCVYLL